ncbi:hypothetical protein GOB92_30630 [Sinorhizobium meliloti]|nr:hypothetical protein [Sinorhizobium meliloti]
MRRGIAGLSALVEAVIKEEPGSGAIFGFRGKRAQLPTFCIRFSFCDDRISLASAVREKGAGLAVSARRKSLMSIYTDERPDLSRELPNWMFDELYCGEMRLGPPEISIAGLNELAAALASFGATRTRGRFH